MMKKRIILLLWIACLYGAALAQRAGVETIVQGGLLEGQVGSAFQVQAIMGLRCKTWSGGLGVGLDYYASRSIPLFLDLRKTFGNAVVAPFVYATGGYNFPWLKEEEKEWGYSASIGGLYAGAGLGCQFAAGKKTHWFITAGYSQKQYENQFTYPVYIDIYPPVPQQSLERAYQLRRLSLQIGLRF